MGKRVTGGLLVFAAAVLSAAWYLSAATFMSGASSWNAELFRAGLNYTGNFLPIMALLLLCTGAAMIVSAFLEDWKKK